MILQPFRAGSASANGASAASSVANRVPTTLDNAAKGFALTSLWLAMGQMFKPVAAPTLTAATWGVLPRVSGLPVDIIGSANIKFAGGTTAQVAGYVGSAFDIAVTIGGTETIGTVNILASGRLDDAGVQKFASRADAGTEIVVAKVYDQSGANHAVRVNGRQAPALVWDDVLDAYVIFGYRTGQLNLGMLQLPVGVAVARNAYTMLMFGRSPNSSGDSDVGHIATMGTWTSQISSWQLKNAGGHYLANNPQGGNREARTSTGRRRCGGLAS